MNIGHDIQADLVQVAAKLLQTARQLERKRWAVYCEGLAEMIEKGQASAGTSQSAFRSMAKSLRECED